MNAPLALAPSSAIPMGGRRSSKKAADAKIVAAGILIVASNQTALFLKRSKEGDHSGEWCIPGGKCEDKEPLDVCAIRETREETGWVAEGDLTKIYSGETIPGVTFTTFRTDIQNQFIPTLDSEHTGYAWAPLHDPPEPVHPGLRAVLDNMNLRASDNMPLRIAKDKKSVRSFDPDGRLHVAVTNISKACVNPYYGHEIPGYEILGLEPNKIYKLLRDPEELQKAVDSYNGVPLLLQHQAATADDHPSDLVIGATGTDAEFVYPYLRNSLVIWPEHAVELIESGEQKELSCGYRYTPDMTPGTFKGEPYDGVMRDIVGNHVALVKEGRAGSDVAVGDRALIVPEDVAWVLLEHAIKSMRHRSDGKVQRSA